MKIGLPELEGVAIGEFKPCVVYYKGIRATEMILEDCPTVWTPWPPNSKEHSVDLGYHSFDGHLVGIRIWGDVAQNDDRKTKAPTQMEQENDG